MNTKQKVLVVDDHPIFRGGLVSMINGQKDLSVTAEASDATEALKRFEETNPDLAIVDVSLEGMNGIDLSKCIRTRFPKARILVLSMHKEALYAERALRAGANGYIMKRESGPTLMSAIRQVLQGHTYVSPEFNERLIQRLSTSGRAIEKSPVEQLSDRELEVFKLIGEGYGTRQISEELNVSMKTVESHREHIRAKLGLETTFQLVQRAIHWIHEEAQ